MFYGSLHTWEQKPKTLNPRFFTNVILNHTVRVLWYSLTQLKWNFVRVWVRKCQSWSLLRLHFLLTWSFYRKWYSRRSTFKAWLRVWTVSAVKDVRVLRWSLTRCFHREWKFAGVDSTEEDQWKMKTRSILVKKSEKSATRVSVWNSICCQVKVRSRSVYYNRSGRWQ